MSKSRTSPRKFSEKIALLNKKESEANAEFEKIIKEVEATTRAAAAPLLSRNESARRATASGATHSSGRPAVTSNTHYDPVQWPSIQEQHWQQYHHQPRHHHHHHHHHQQHQPSSNLPHQCQPPPQSHYDLQTDPASPSTYEVPNIKIFPIDEDNSDQKEPQQVPTSVQSVNFAAYDNYESAHHQGSIVSARSLPDISNLRSAAISAPNSAAIRPFYQHHRHQERTSPPSNPQSLNTSCTNLYQEPRTSVGPIRRSPSPTKSQSPITTPPSRAAAIVQPSSSIHHYHHRHQQGQLSSSHGVGSSMTAQQQRQQQTLHPPISYSAPQGSGSDDGGGGGAVIMRASSSNAIVGCWQDNTSSERFYAPKPADNYLSKSYTEDYNLNDYNPSNFSSDTDPCAPIESYPMMRSNSYGNFLETSASFSNNHQVRHKTHQPQASSVPTSTSPCQCYECSYSYYP